MKQVTSSLRKSSQRKSLRSAISALVLSVVLPLAVFGRIVPNEKPMDVKNAAGESCCVVCDSRCCALHLQSGGASTNVTLDQVLLASGAGSVEALPAKLFLDQNYPNPFNPSTMIRYGLPSGTNVKLTIHTLLGNQIKTVVDLYQDGGVYTIDVAANDLPSGVYFYRLQTELGTLTRRMTISK